MAMRAELANQHEALAALCGAYDVARLEVFGSAARGTDFDPHKSDFDFLVSFKPDSSLPPLEQFLGLSQELEALLGRHVDLVEAASVTNPFVQASIDQSREIVYGT